MREAGDQVHADVGEARSSEKLIGAIDVSAAMHAARGLQLAVVKRLDAQADAIEAGFEPRSGLFRRDRFGVGFECDFALAGEVESRPQRLNDSGKGSGS